MGFRLGRIGTAIVAAALLFAASSVSAKPTESQEDSLHSQFESLASRLKAEGQRAIDAAARVTARAVDASKGAIAETQTDLGPRLETFRQTLNEQKAKLAMIGADAAARLEAWKQAATKSWSEMWSEASAESWRDTWTESWAEIQRATTEVLDRFRDWIDKQQNTEEQTQTPV